MIARETLASFAIVDSDDLIARENIRDFTVVYSGLRLLGFEPRDFCFHLPSGIFSQNGIRRSGARRAASKGMEGLPALPEIPMLR